MGGGGGGRCMVVEYGQIKKTILLLVYQHVFTFFAQSILILFISLNELF